VTLAAAGVTGGVHTIIPDVSYDTRAIGEAVASYVLDKIARR
jgi:hypothetical protein